MATDLGRALMAVGATLVEKDETINLLREKVARLSEPPSRCSDAEKIYVARNTLEALQSWLPSESPLSVKVAHALAVLRGEVDEDDGDHIDRSEAV